MNENTTNLNPLTEDQHRSNWRELGNFAHDETPAGLIDGANLIFTLANAPKAGTLVVTQNGMRTRPTVDYLLTLDAVTGKGVITFVVAPGIGDWIAVDYRY